MVHPGFVVSARCSWCFPVQRACIMLHDAHFGIPKPHSRHQSGWTHCGRWEVTLVGWCRNDQIWNWVNCVCDSMSFSIIRWWSPGLSSHEITKHLCLWYHETSLDFLTDTKWQVQEKFATEDGRQGGFGGFGQLRFQVLMDPKEAVLEVRRTV